MPLLLIPPFLYLAQARRKSFVFETKLGVGGAQRAQELNSQGAGKIEAPGKELAREREIGLANNCWGHLLLPLSSFEPLSSCLLPALFHILRGANLHEPCNGNYGGHVACSVSCAAS